MQDNWMKKSLAELRAEAKERGLKGISGMKKQELADLLSGTVTDTKETGEEGRTAVTSKEVRDVRADAPTTDTSAEWGKAVEKPPVAEKTPEIVASDSEENSGNRSDYSSRNQRVMNRRENSNRDNNNRDNSNRESNNRENNIRDNNRENSSYQRRNNYGSDNARRYNSSSDSEGVRRYNSDNRESGNRRYASDNRDNNNRRSQDNNRRYNSDSRDNTNRRYNNQDSDNNTPRRYNNPDGDNNTTRRYNNPEGDNHTARRYNNPEGDNHTPRRYNNQDNDNNISRRYSSQDSAPDAKTNSMNTYPEVTPRTVAVDEDGRELVYMDGWNTGTKNDGMALEDMKSLDSGEVAYGILEVLQDRGCGFIRGANFLSTDEDIYVSPSQIRRFDMRTGDIIRGSIRVRTGTEKFPALLYVTEINGEHPSAAEHRPKFEDLTPIFPNERLHLECEGCSKAMRIVDLLSPVGKGQRGMIVSPPKAGKTTLLKEIARAIKVNHPDTHLIILLIDERPEEVTDIKECIEGPNVEVIYSTFDELPEHHKAVSEMVLGRAKRLVEHGRDTVILLDSITRLARAYNLTVASSGKTLSGGLDPAALHMPKKFFGAARNIREGGSLTILATALVDTGSRMDDVVFEEFKGTGNMEVVLDRRLSERRIFPAIDIAKSGTRRDDLILNEDEQEAVEKIRRGLNGMKAEEATEQVLNMFSRTKSNKEFVAMMKSMRF